MTVDGGDGEHAAGDTVGSGAVGHWLDRGWGPCCGRRDRRGSRPRTGSRTANLRVRTESPPPEPGRSRQAAISTSPSPATATRAARATGRSSRCCHCCTCTACPAGDFVPALALRHRAHPLQARATPHATHPGRSAAVHAAGRTALVHRVAPRRAGLPLLTSAGLTAPLTATLSQPWRSQYPSTS